MTEVLEKPLPVVVPAPMPNTTVVNFHTFLYKSIGLTVAVLWVLAVLMFVFSFGFTSVTWDKYWLPWTFVFTFSSLGSTALFLLLQSLERRWPYVRL